MALSVVMVFSNSSFRSQSRDIHVHVDCNVQQKLIHSTRRQYIVIMLIRNVSVDAIIYFASINV